MRSIHGVDHAVAVDVSGVGALGIVDVGQLNGLKAVQLVVRG
jgi:hypothetical protein